jgi:hypothetical protein
VFGQLFRACDTNGDDKDWPKTMEDAKGEGKFAVLTKSLSKFPSEATTSFLNLLLFSTEEEAIDSSRHPRSQC